jgi:dTDP-4-amino-4,6-dideoxy-D-galactose acyltransferase
VLLTAVGPANRGWHLKLMAETLHRARALGHEAVLMTTQPTNQAVLRTTEKLGFRLGGAAHVLACSSSQP